ncbi:hypothetical protein SCUCBS95973_006712 [Sporothrix curviconia]|uniref:Uncharacterized protein n=1 Tax=Sporothrix curviconia TaxID=1260050 RepID=A0ABP0C7R3_9PEZI
MESAANETEVKAEIYDTDRFAELYRVSQDPPLASLGLAARFLVSFFQTNGIAFAFLGGWAVYLRGGWRRTQDVDICVNTTMEHLKSLLLRERRLCVPQIHGLTCIQVFVHTGVGWDDVHFPGTPYVPISVDIIINGYLGTPQGLPNGTESILPVPVTTQGTAPVSAVDLFYQMSSKLQAHYSRRTLGGTNDYIDLVFLVTSFSNTVWEMRGFLNLEHRWAFFNDFFATSEGDTTGVTTNVQLTLGLPDDGEQPQPLQQQQPQQG